MNTTTVNNKIAKVTGLEKSKKSFYYGRESYTSSIVKKTLWDGDFHVEKYYMDVYTVYFDRDINVEKIDEVVEVLKSMGLKILSYRENIAWSKRKTIVFQMGK